MNKELLENVDKTTENIELNDAEIKILELIKSNPSYKTTDFIRLTEYSEVYINKKIRNLKDKEYIRRVGSNKSGYWELLK